MKKIERSRSISWISKLVVGSLLSSGILISVAAPAHAVLAPISLGAADSFAVLAGGAITNTAPTGNTLVRGDLGTFPNAATFVGATSTTISGVNYGADSTAQAAQTSLAAANVAIAALPVQYILPAAMSGALTRGVYDQTSAVTLATTLTFDAEGDSSSVFVIRVVGAMATAAASNIILANGAQSSNIFWKVTGAVSLGAGSTFRGNILSVGAITTGAGTVVDGRLFTEIGALSMASSTITKPGWTPPSYTVSFSGNTHTSGSTSAQTANSSTALTSNGFTKTGYTFSGWNTVANGSGTAYADGAAYLFAASTTLHAQWSPTSNSVTYALNGGAGSLPTQASVASAGTFTLATSTGITKAGYTFSGWNDGSSTSGASATYTMGTTAITLTAQWSVIVVAPTPVSPVATTSVAQEEIDKAAADRAAAQAAKVITDKAATDRAAVQAAKVLTDKAAADRAAVQAAKEITDKAAADRAAEQAAQAATVLREVPSRIPSLIGELTLGTSLATANGVFIPTTLRIIPPSVEATDLKAVEIAGDGWKVVIATTNSAVGASALGQSDMSVVIEKGAVSSTEGTGFKPGSLVRLRLFSTPSLLGEVRARADGSFSANWMISEDKASGEHTLQVEGISPSGSLLRAEIGVFVRAKSPKQTVLLGKVFFGTSIWKLTAENKKKLNVIAKNLTASSHSKVWLHGFTDMSKGVDNLTLSRQRNSTVKTYLQNLLPAVSINVKSFGASNPSTTGVDKASLSLNRRVEIFGKK